MQQMARITASAAALEAGKYDPRSLDEVAERTDELGQLARVFGRMADEVVAREERLKQEVVQLRIEIDEAKRARDVARSRRASFSSSFSTRQRNYEGIRDDNRTPASPAGARSEYFDRTY